MWLVLGALAVINLTNIVWEGKIAQPLREFFGVLHNQRGKRVGYVKPSGWRGFWHEVLSCYWCTSVWTSLPIALCFGLSTKLYKMVGMWLGFSYVAVEIKKRWG